MTCSRCGSPLHRYDNCPDVAEDKRVDRLNVEFRHRQKVGKELERIRQLLGVNPTPRKE